MRFDIADLLVFVRVAETGSITRASARVHRTVASVSVRIKEMESEYGQPLLLRERRGIALTDAGKRLLSHAYRILGDVQNMHDDMVDYSGRSRGTLTISCNSIALQEVLPNMLADFLLQNPKHQVEPSIS